MVVNVSVQKQIYRCAREDRRVVGTSADSLKDDEMESLIVYELHIKVLMQHAH
jgi:hypothetical protein